MGKINRGQKTGSKRLEARAPVEEQHNGEPEEPPGLEYAKSSMDEPLMQEVCRSVIYESILNVLKFMTYSNQEIGEDYILSEMSTWIAQSPEAGGYLDRVSRSLDQSGFYELLRLSLSDAPSRAADMDRLELLSEMARRDITMFFSERPPIPGLPSILLHALFPEDERQYLVLILESSPSAFRAFQMAKEGRSSSLSVASLHQVLPILTRMFELFATTDASQCTEKSRQAWAKEIVAIANRSKEDPRPTPIVKVLEAIWRMDNTEGRLGSAES